MKVFRVLVSVVLGVALLAWALNTPGEQPLVALAAGWLIGSPIGELLAEGKR